MSNDIELLPCPFCGNSPHHNASYSNIECDTEGCYAASVQIADAANASEIWNTRAALAAPQQEPITDEFITAVIESICEFDDRSSPEDQPEMMLVTADELRNTIRGVEETFSDSGEPVKEPAAPSLSDHQLFRMAVQIRELVWDGEPYPDLLESLRKIQKENSPPAAPALSDEDRSDALQDLQFVAGFEAGWNAGVDGNEALLSKVRARSKPARTILAKVTKP
jgi:hypothetical protein